MYKVGDFVIAKDFNSEEYLENFYPLDANKSYKIVSISRSYFNTDINKTLYMLNVLTKNGVISLWSDYFYSKEELRKMKLNKIYNGNR